jgi:hypothetical protein
MMKSKRLAVCADDGFQATRESKGRMTARHANAERIEGPTGQNIVASKRRLGREDCRPAGGL